MTSQLKLHSLNKSTDFTFCDIPKTKHLQKQGEDDNQFGFSPRLWSKNINSSNCICPSSPMIAMVEGRKELMEALNDLPESCYELSLKDMVSQDTEPKSKENDKGANKGSISRSVSLDTGVILLKMFVPSSFGFKKRKVSRSTSVNGLQRYHIDTKECKTRLFAENRCDTNNKSCSNNPRYTAPTRNRYAEETLKPGCWFRTRSTNQKGCIFF
uniref:uncharacterized protein LOC122589790 n=1 Tax=Erigeron canadensis TaxID=72917 RepID=UPI001CB8C0D0|nr:uncharacterized protein LOC122589790 [Erigeron canadensis]